MVGCVSWELCVTSVGGKVKPELEREGGSVVRATVDSAAIDVVVCSVTVDDGVVVLTTGNETVCVIGEPVSRETVTCCRVLPGAGEVIKVVSWLKVVSLAAVVLLCGTGDVFVGGNVEGDVIACVATGKVCTCDVLLNPEVNVVEVASGIVTVSLTISVIKVVADGDVGEVVVLPGSVSSEIKTAVVGIAPVVVTGWDVDDDVAVGSKVDMVCIPETVVLVVCVISGEVGTFVVGTTVPPSVVVV